MGKKTKFISLREVFWVVLICVFFTGTLRRFISKSGYIETSFRFSCITLFILLFVYFIIYLAKFFEMNENRKQRRIQAKWDKRYYALMEKYNDHDSVVGVMHRRLWRGMTDEMVRDSIGSPSAIDQEAMKTKLKETWKFFPVSANRFSLKVNLEDDRVVGWDCKDRVLKSIERKQA